MKLNRILSIALLIPAMVALNSCADDYAVDTDYTPAEVVDGPQVYFHETISTDVPVTEAEPNFSIDFYRVSSESEDVVELKLEAEEGVLELFEMPDFVTFAAGSKVATLQCKALFPDDEHMPYDKVFPVKISVAKAEDATLYAFSSLTFNIVRPAPWKSLGKGKFCDTFLGGPDYYEVEIQQNELYSNIYRLVNPYAEILGDIPVDKYFQFEILAPGTQFRDYVLDDEYIMYSDYNSGQWNSNYPEDIFLIHPYRFGMELSLWKYNKVLDYQSNGLPGEVSIAPYYFLFNVGGGWNQTKETTISILFPGYRKRDYSSSVEFEGTFKAENGTTYAVGNLILGGDATDVKAVVMPADADAKAVADAIAAGEVLAIDVSSGRIEVPFDAEELGSEKLQIIVAVIANNVVKSFDNASFDYYGEGGSPWKSLGTGYYTDDILGSMWGLPPTTYEVEILEHTENPGLYRLVNPYNNKVYPAEYAELFASSLNNSLAPEGYTLEVNATDPEGVYIQKQTLGLDFGDGEWAFETEGSRYLSNYDIVMLKEAGYMGAVMDGVIRFPAFSFNASDGSKRAYQGILYEGGSGYYSATNAQLEIVLPSANAFARNMAVAKAKTTQRTALKKSFSGVKVDVKMKKLFLDSNIEKMEIVKY